MANKPDSTSIVSMNSPTRNSRDDLSMVEQAKKTVKRVMIAKMVSKPESPSIYHWSVQRLHAMPNLEVVSQWQYLKIPPQNKALSGVAIGGAVSFNVIIAGPITGASMNPGRSIGAAIAAGAYKNLWVYIVAPVLGSLAAILVYCLLRVPESEKEETSTNINHKDFYFHPDV
ncbi:aquaporin NIP2-3-like [Coffea eugenioides]|uniref:aquaporin NIP2-3-like n=1 Tax=Coffea eugenioides TaxID=49369 RepID=UPI000F6088D8|nr:aquaporin NIP2-3-like [Coffea eugenioides]